MVTFFEHSSAFDLDKYEKKMSRPVFPFGSSFSKLLLSDVCVSMVAGFFFHRSFNSTTVHAVFSKLFFFLKFIFQFAFFCFLSVLAASILVDIALFIVSVLP